MGSYSIKDLEKVSGIKAHTIRIWEKRYDLITPGRSMTNIRSYSDNDLKRLINISILARNGLKISKIALLSDQEIKDKVLLFSGMNSNSNSNIVENLVLSMIELNDQKFDKAFSAVIFNDGFESAFIKVMYPFFDKIGVLWQTGCINSAHEHFVSNLVRQKLIVAIDGQHNELGSKNEKFILFCPEGEFHELGLLFYHYILRRRGYKVMYLGQSVPFEDLKNIAESFQADSFLTVINSPSDADEIKDYFKLLNQAFPGKSIYAGGDVLNQIKPNFPNVKIIKSPESFIEALKIAL